MRLLKSKTKVHFLRTEGCIKSGIKTRRVVPPKGCLLKECEK